MCRALAPTGCWLDGLDFRLVVAKVSVPTDRPAVGGRPLSFLLDGGGPRLTDRTVDSGLLVVLLAISSSLGTENWRNLLWEEEREELGG